MGLMPAMPRFRTQALIGLCLALALLAVGVAWNAFKVADAEMRAKSSQDLLSAVTLRGQQI